MSDQQRDLYRGPHLGHLLAGALERHAHSPVLHIGVQALTGIDLAEDISRYVQALEQLGISTGSPVRYCR